MSYYYEYYIGYRHDGKIYPWGAYDARGSLHSVLCRSRSFSSDLHDRFHAVTEDAISDELRQDFEYERWDGKKVVDVKWLPVTDLPDGSYIKKGYFLIKDVMAYEEERDWFDGFYDVISPTIYAALLDKELKFGKNQPQKDCEGYEYTEPNASDYMFYAYPDEQSEEYESHVIREALEAIRDYDMLEGTEWVVLETEG